MREPREHLKTLQRRVDFLKSRDHKNSFDLAELGSLEWALVNLQTERKPLTDEQKLMCWSRATHDADVEHKTENQCLMDYGSEIEAAHGIKEQP